MAQLSHLLLFDPDPSGLETLTYGFEKDGCSITGTVDPNQVRELIHSASPELLLISLRDSEKTGLDLVRTTTSNPRTRNLACVVIGREEMRAPALAAGAFGFLTLPLFVRDILGACRLVRAASVPGSRPSPDAELLLNLAEVDGIYFLVRALAVTGRSAVIDATRENKRGELRFIDGTLTSVQLGPVEGLPALHQMLLWDDATLRFKFKNVVRRGTQLSMKSSEVIEECDRFLRDFAHETKDLGIARTVYDDNLGGVQPSEALPGEVVPLLKLFDGRRDLAQVLEDSPFRIFDTLKIIRRFVAGEAIRIRAALPPSGREAVASLSGPGALDVWLQRSSHILDPEVRIVHLAQNGSHPKAGNGSNPDPANGGAENRPPSPFVPVAAVAPIVTAAESNPDQQVADSRAKTISKRKTVEPPPPAQPEAVELPAPPVPPTEAPSKPLAFVARGEIKTAPRPERHSQSVPAQGAPTVLVEMEPPLPEPIPLTSMAPAPVTARSAPPTVTPPTVTTPTVALPTVALPSVAPPNVASPTVAPPTVAPPTVAPPTVIVAPMTPAPIGTARQANHTAAPGGNDQKRSPRSPSDNFSPVESDFFAREADLYKGESVENFEDLDGTARPDTRGNGPVRKR
jgi:CheY-like chemotaxis protein